MNDPQFIVDPTRDYYAVLGVSAAATADEIRVAYKRMAVRYHPDNKDTGNEEKFKQAAEANGILKDPDTRAYYDRIRKEYDSNGDFKYSRTKRKKPKAKRGRKKGFWDNPLNKTLREQVIDSLDIFARMKRELPDYVLTNFRSAVEFVYMTWHELQKQQDENGAGMVLFGPFALPKSDLLKNETLLEE